MRFICVDTLVYDWLYMQGSVIEHTVHLIQLFTYNMHNFFLSIIHVCGQSFPPPFFFCQGAGAAAPKPGPLPARGGAPVAAAGQGMGAVPD